MQSFLGPIEGTPFITTKSGFPFVDSNKNQQVKKADLAKVVDPTTLDDSGAGYSIGSRIITTAGKVWECVDASPLAAVWKDLSATSPPGGSNGQLQYNNAGEFGGVTGSSWNGTTLTLQSASHSLISNTSGTGTWAGQFYGPGNSNGALFGNVDLAGRFDGTVKSQKYTTGPYTTGYLSLANEDGTIWTMFVNDHQIKLAGGTGINWSSNTNFANQPILTNLQGSASGGLSLSTYSATAVPFKINLFELQTANAFEVNSFGGSGGNLLKITSNGTIVLASTVNPAYQTFIAQNVNNTDITNGNGQINLLSSITNMGNGQARVHDGQFASRGNGGYGMGADSTIRWTSHTNDFYQGTVDTGIGRNSAGVVEINNGTAGQYGDVRVRDSILSFGRYLKWAGTNSYVACGLTGGHAVSIVDGNTLAGFHIGNAQGGPFAVGTTRIDGHLSAGYTADLHITSGGTFGDNQTAGNLHLHGGQNWAGGTNSNGGLAYLYGGKGSGTGSDGNVILCHDGTTTRGNVGVGIASPVQPLHLAGAGDVRLLFTVNSTGHANSDGVFLGFDGLQPTFSFWQRENGDIRIGTNDVERWRFKNTGHLFAAIDNTYNIGTPTDNRPQTGYFGTSLQSPQLIAVQNDFHSLKIIGSLTNTGDDSIELVNWGLAADRNLILKHHTGGATKGNIRFTVRDTAIAPMISSEGNYPFDVGGNSGVAGIRIDGSLVAGETRFLLYDVDSALLQRVKVGANGTGPGGVGRALYIANN